jgi:hypothetical protein
MLTDADMIFLFFLLLFWLIKPLILKFFFTDRVNFLPDFFTISLSLRVIMYTLSLGIASFYLPVSDCWYPIILVIPGY